MPGSTKNLKEAGIRYLASLRNKDTFEFRLCEDNEPTLIGSSLAAMLGCFLGFNKSLPENEKDTWAEYINGHQRDDGWYEDFDIYEVNLCPGYKKDRALLHRTRHALLALYSLGRRPKTRFDFTARWLSAGSMTEWCE